jgi:hypothetical protein
MVATLAAVVQRNCRRDSAGREWHAPQVQSEDLAESCRFIMEILPDACCCCELHAIPIEGALPARRHFASTRSGSLPTRPQLPKRKSVCGDVARLVGGKTKKRMTDVMRSLLRRLVGVQCD